jgi:Ser/Thr protein kinase RdoA (MazF antagonist)
VHAAAPDALLIELLSGRSMTPWDSDALPAVAQVLAAASRRDAPPPGIPRLDPHRTMAAAAAKAGSRLPEEWGFSAAERAHTLITGAPLVMCHADLVPANVVITPTGRVKLIDPEPRLAPLSYDLSLLAYRFAEGEDFESMAEVVARAAGVPTGEVAAWGPVHAYTQSAWRRANETSTAAAALVEQLDTRHAA